MEHTAIWSIVAALLPLVLMGKRYNYMPLRVRRERKDKP